ncbi:MAG: response regulator [Cyanobacteriota bacterium]|nr:response regulator [Cyanobacteriota bacterium]
MKNILIIEDNIQIRDSIQDILELKNFQISTADNGVVGLQQVRDRIPDLILCDIIMPELDGCGVLRQLRQDPTTATVPFIFLTSKVDWTSMREGMELGADDYLAKPFTSEELLKSIETRLKKRSEIERESQHQLDRLRGNIVRALPHELNTPLNGILSFANFLIEEAETVEPEEIRDMAAQIHGSGKRLYRLVQNFLLYAELESIATQPTRISELRTYRSGSIERIVSDLATKQVQKHQRYGDLKIDIHNISLPISEYWLNKLVEELLDNAFKFSSEGSPVLISSAIDNGTLVLSVSDRGRGMSADRISQVGAYMQFDRKIYEQQGAGLGLTIAKRIVELHGGFLTIQSFVNRGTKVYVRFPIVSKNRVFSLDSKHKTRSVI